VSARDSYLRSRQSKPSLRSRQLTLRRRTAPLPQLSLLLTTPQPSMTLSGTLRATEREVKHFFQPLSLPVLLKINQRRGGKSIGIK